MQKVIAIDFDDVIAGFNQAYASHSREMYDSNVSYEDIHTFDMSQLYDVSVDEIAERVREFCHNHHNDIEPIEGVVEQLQVLSKRFALHLVTSRCQTLREITEGWLHSYDIGKCFQELHFTNGFGSSCKPKRTKLEVCRAIDAQVLIEDAPVNALELAEAGIPVLMPDRPWNQKVTHSSIRRYKNWSIAHGWIQKNI